MKRLLSFVLVLTMLATMFVGVTAVQADETATIKLVGATVDSNGQFDVTITLQNDTDLLAGQIGIKYDTTKLTAVSVAASDYISGLGNESNIADGIVKVMFDAETATSFATAQDVATVKFQVAGGVDYSTVAFEIDGDYTEIATAPDYAVVTYTLDASDFVLADEKCLHEDTYEDVTLEATCTTAGSKNIICRDCGEKVGEETIPELGHTEGDWITDREATTIAPGLKHQICSVCKETIATEDIPMLEEDGVLDQGTAGTDVIWKLYDDGTLKIIGTSENAVMADYSENKRQPYYDYRSDKSITKFVVENVPRLGNRAFCNFPYVDELEIDETTTEIGNWAFYHCQSFLNVTIEGKLTKIGNGNFYDTFYTTKLAGKNSTLKLPGMTKAEYDAIDVTGSANTDYGNYTVETSDNVFGISGTLGWLLNYDEGALTFTGYGVLADYNSSSKLSPWSPYGDKIVNVKFSSGITKIGGTALYDLPNLKSVVLPATVEELGKYAISYCPALETVRMYANIKKVGSGCIYNSPSSLKKVEFLGSSEEYNAISGIGSNSYLSNITKEYRQAQDGGSTGDCSWMIDQFGVLVISGTGAMADYTAENPAPWSQSEYADTITEVEIKSGVTYLGNYAFAGLSNVEYAMVPVSVNYIGNYAFANDAKLAKIDIADRLFEIREGAFSGCTALNEINYTGSKYAIASIAVFAGNTAFDEVETVNFISPAARTIIASGDCASNATYPVTWTIYDDGVMVISGTGTIKSYPDDSARAPYKAYDSYIKTIVVEEKVGGLLNKAFYDLQEVEAIYLSDTINSVGSNALSYNPKLKTIAMGGVTSIAANRCYGDSALERVIFNTAEGGATINDATVQKATIIYTK